jgi:hypothetical protein
MAQSTQQLLKFLPGMLVASLFVLVAAPAKADIYKCESAQGKTVYSDTPCHSSSTQTLTDIRPDVVENPQPQDKTKSVVIRQLDEAVKSAIATGDFMRANALAVTSEQHGWIASASKDSDGKAAAGRSQTTIAAEKSESGECRQAKLELEREANSSFHKADVLKAKTSLMRAACGLNEQSDPDYDQTYVNQNVPFLFDTHRRYSYRNLGRWPHNPRPPHAPPENSPPYDRYMEKPFGSSYIRPQDPAR